MTGVALQHLVVQLRVRDWWGLAAFVEPGNCTSTCQGRVERLLTYAMIYSF